MPPRHHCAYAPLQSMEQLITEKRQPPEGCGEDRWVRYRSRLMDRTKMTDWSLVDVSGAELPVELLLPGARYVLSGVLQDGGSRL